ncbi:hypothetical protein MRX96_032283, partial [Rhipicephalus microplus]
IYPRPSRDLRICYLTFSMSSAQHSNDFYSQGKAYWETIPATIDGMLGGYSEISSIDIHSSNRLLKHFRQARQIQQLKHFCALAGQSARVGVSAAEDALSLVTNWWRPGVLTTARFRAVSHCVDVDFTWIGLSAVANLVGVAKPCLLLLNYLFQVGLC